MASSIKDKVNEFMIKKRKLVCLTDRLDYLDFKITTIKIVNCINDVLAGSCNRSEV